MAFWNILLPILAISCSLAPTLFIVALILYLCKEKKFAKFFLIGGIILVAIAAIAFIVFIVIMAQPPYR